MVLSLPKLWEFRPIECHLGWNTAIERFTLGDFTHYIRARYRCDDRNTKRCLENEDVITLPGE